MGIIERYIARTWLKLFGLCLGSFLSIYLVLAMVDRIPGFLRLGAALPDIFLFFLYKFPEMISQAAPFSVLMTTLFTLGQFSRNSELIAMRSCGISLQRISIPILLLGIIASVLLLVNAELIIPAIYPKRDYIERVLIKKQAVNAFFKRNNIWFRSGEMIVQAQLFEPNEKTLKGVVIWTLDGKMNPKRRIDAISAKYNGAQWILGKVYIKEFAEGSGFTQKEVPEIKMALSLKIDDLKVLDKNADNMSFVQLKEYAENLKRAGYPADRYLTMMHTKLAGPSAAIVMVLLGIPFAMKNSRSGGIAMGIGISVAVGFAYFVVNAVFLSFGRSGALPPAAAGYGANILFGCAGIWLTMRASGLKG